MPTSNVVELESFKRHSEQELIDDIGARAFMFIRDEAESKGLDTKKVVAEHMLGLALVMQSVEGKAEVERVLEQIRQSLA